MRGRTTPLNMKGFPVTFTLTVMKGLPTPRVMKD